MREAVAITGMGAVTAQGVGVEATWRGICEGREILRTWEGVSENHPLRKIMVGLCGEIARPADLPMRLWRPLSRTQQLGCAAVDEALAMAGLPRQIGEKAGMFLATTVCGMDVTEQFYAQYRLEKNTADAELMRRLQPYELRHLLARRHGVGDIGWVCLSTCVGSAMAIAAACDAIALGECELAIAGGSEAICRVVLSGFHSLKVTAAEGCRPFDKDRPGMTVGEGAGMLVLESVEHAQRRGAKILAMIGGVGITCDAHHLTAPEPSGLQAVRAMREALRRAKIDPSEIRYVNAHGTGTRDNDAMEAKAIEAVFGTENVWVSSTKRGTGHTFGAAGAVETILAVEAIRNGILPMNAGSVVPEEGMGIRIVRGTSRAEKVAAVMSTNFAFGGNNTAIVLTGLNYEDTKTRRGERGGECRSILADKLSVFGIGIVGDAMEMGAEEKAIAEKVSGMDMLAALVIRAADGAWRMAGMDNGEEVGLIVCTAWGVIDATVGYLDSMLEADGKYASPRHFSRSVYSSAASLAAIHFGIHGPCLTLVFDGDYVRGAIAQARRMIAGERAGRCKRVLVVWADQYAAIAAELAKIGVERLHQKKYVRYVARGLGEGAVAVLLGGDEGGLGAISVEETRGIEPAEGKPYATDAALGWIKKWFRERLPVK